MTVIRNAVIFNGLAGKILVGHEVVIKDRRIIDIRKNTHVSLSNERVVDGQGGYLLPGFIDMHAHILIPRCDLPQSKQDVIFDIPLSERMLGIFPDFGITTIRSPSNPTVAGLALRDRANAGHIRAPYILAATELINDRKLNTAKIRELIRGTLPYKPDFVKLYAAIGPAEVEAAIDEAHANHVRVIGHLGRTSWKEAADMGIDFLTHAVDWSEKSLAAEKREKYRLARTKRGRIKARINWLELFEPDSMEISKTILSIAKAGTSIDPTLVAYDTKFSPPDSPRYRKTLTRMFCLS